MDVRRRIYAGIARQLGHPAGLAGRLVGVALNLGDRKHVTAAVDALSIPPGGVVADVGFGGGVGIALLLDRVGASGRVHGVDVSSEMLRRAARRFREEISAGRLELYQASMTDRRSARRPLMASSPPTPSTSSPISIGPSASSPAH
jgi:arsenite methyltransferase